MKCMKMRQATCLSGCWNAAAEGVVAEASVCLSQEFDQAGMLWRWTSLWLIASAQHSLMDLFESALGQETHEVRAFYCRPLVSG